MPQAPAHQTRQTTALDEGRSGRNLFARSAHCSRVMRANSPQFAQGDQDSRTMRHDPCSLTNARASQAAGACAFRSSFGFVRRVSAHLPGQFRHERDE